MEIIFISAIVVGLVGLIIGVLLGIASEKFAVKVDEKEIEVREALPGNNCGACGYPGCDGLAKAISSGLAKVNACPVGGETVATNIAKIMGVEAEALDKRVAFVRCRGTLDRAKKVYNYDGIMDCNMLSVLPNTSDKDCYYGCMGYGSCVKVCEFDALHIVDGIAVVDKEKCVACEKCTQACPKKLIEMVPYNAEHIVMCRSLDKGKEAKGKCSVACIACTMCVKVCEFDAIHMQGNVAKIDYDKCTNCGKCAAKCPSKIIKTNAEGVVELIA